MCQILPWKKRSLFFIANFHVRVDKKIFVFLIYQAMNGEAVYFVLGSVQSCHIGNHAFTSTIQHRFAWPIRACVVPQLFYKVS